MLLSMYDIAVDVRTVAGSKRLLTLQELTVNQGESIGVVGETGSGKTMASLAVTRLFPSSAIRLSSGTVKFREQDLTKLAEGDLARLRGRHIAMVFQDPSTSLNPVFSIGKTLSDLVITHHKIGKKAARERSVELLRRVELPNPAELLSRHPFELSGGQRQRVLIAMALAGAPELLIADEPTTALDVTVQAGVLSVLRRLQEEEGLSMLLITHNMGLVAHMTRRIYVMYQGTVVESGMTDDVLLRPRHPYTRALLTAVPRWQNRGKRLTRGDGQKLSDQIISSTSAHTGCVFAHRCPHVAEECLVQSPELVLVADENSHKTACVRQEAIYDA